MYVTLWSYVSSWHYDIIIHCLVFRKKDLYLIITQKLIFIKSRGFRADFMWNPPTKLINQIFQEKLQFYGVLWEGYVMFFTWNPPDFERPIARNGKAYVYSDSFDFKVNFKSLLWPQFLTNFHKQYIIWKLRNLLFPTICESHTYRVNYKFVIHYA